METNKYEVALFAMVRQRIVHLGGGIGKTPEALDLEAYRQMQNLLTDADVNDAAIDLENAKRIAEVYG